MTQTNCEIRKIWTIGRHGWNACVTATVSSHTIVATSDGEYITERQMEKVLNREFPRHSFVFNGPRRDYMCADADRWPGDGV